MSDMEDRAIIAQDVMEDDDDVDLYGDDSWKITDDGAAEWCIQQIREAEAITAKWEEHYKAQLEKVRAVQGRRIERFRGYLQRYLRELSDQGLAKGTKTTTSYKLPSGTLKLKKGTWEYQRDEEQLCAWLQASEMTELIKIKTSPDWAGLKKLTMTTDEGKVVLAETGEVIPGVTAAMKPDSFVVEEK